MKIYGGVAVIYKAQLYFMGHSYISVTMDVYTHIGFDDVYVKEGML